MVFKEKRNKWDWLTTAALCMFSDNPEENLKKYIHSVMRGTEDMEILEAAVLILHHPNKKDAVFRAVDEVKRLKKEGVI